ncbi:MAG: hypothetical protein QF755_02390 [Candidatus Peribacteraceae bacterium]|jgi:hypothetical protein|nr:hypothetical protein [Parcubacteria group bacterium]MDP6575321.1 hypothetical protein [Candidatus Peribacteraceae bacterium]HCI04184.1 hypothetical protein [Candidatus Peribacteria bacterium]|tara:strand:+ start:4329 stop:5354 length:1026 start_codon:yes stop_codon:yes gene_type:complete
MDYRYVRLLPRAFKRFCIVKAFRTGLPTAFYYIRRKPLLASDKPALFTMNILPPMMTVWYHLATKYLGDRVDITIFDSSGKLNPKEFPEARVHKFLNLYAATKSEEFLRHIAKNRKIGWICDDDMFLLSGEAVDVVEREFADPNIATVSFRHRKWWEFDIDGKRIPPSSSYCIAFNRELVFEKENLHLGPCDGNTHPGISKNPTRYDTFDKANEELLKKGYRCYIVPEPEQKKYWAGFSGLSGPVMLLNYFKKPEQTLSYFTEPPNEKWSSNMLFGVLSGMISICTIQELYTKIKGNPYPLRALPSRDELMKLYEEKKPYMRDDQNLEEVEETSERLRNAI